MTSEDRRAPLQSDPTLSAFRLDEALEQLTRTPAVLRNWLADLSDVWLDAREAPETWSPREILGHLIHGERTDWIPRARSILERGEEGVFEPFDRFAQLGDPRRPARELIATFTALRAANLEELQSFALDDELLSRHGTHPELGRVTMRELLATWVVHDLAHLAQIARAMSMRCATAVGPWRSQVSILRPRS